MDINEVRSVLAPTGTLRAGINMSNFLLVSATDADGQPDGLSPSVARAMAKALGVGVELVLFDSPGVLSDAVNDDVWDVANIAFEPERAAHISFSQPYILIDANFQVRAGSPLTENRQMNSPDVTIILYDRSAYDLWLKENFTRANYLRVASIQESHDRFYAGEGDVLASLKPKLVSDNAEGYKIIKTPFTDIKQSVGISKHREQALPFINGLLEEMLRSGEIKAILEKFGVDDRLSLPAISS
jgi:polar amino acid transport system substrate-binding protein